jgi:YihY family inner membrane protein
VGLVSGLDRLQQRRPKVGLPIAVVYKYVDDSGGYLAALITYYAFVSLFPLLLILTTVLGIVLAGHPGLQHRIETSALSQFPVIGDDLGQPRRIGGGAAGLVIGIAGALYGGLGVAQATQYAMNTVWAVPRNNRPNPVKARARSLLILATVGVAVLGTTALSALGTTSAGSLGTLLRIGLVAVAVTINTAVCVFVFRLAPARRLSFADILPGAFGAALSWQVLQTFGVAYVTHVIKHASATNSVFAVVLGLLAFLYLTAVATILCVEINAVRVDRLYPRALLTPFTDNVDLTTGDERTYTGQARAQRAKGFEDIDVTFDKSDKPNP